MKENVFTAIMVSSFVVLSLLCAGSVPAATEGKLPLFQGAMEIACSDDDQGACLETPTVRFQVSTSDDLATVVRKLLAQSKELGWKMQKVTGTDSPRYQSSNGKGFYLLWSVENAGKKTSPSGQLTYYIYYWKIYGE